MISKIVNIIANTDVHDKFNLNNLSAAIDDTEYEPEIYFALIYRLKIPKCSILINASGKIIFSGATSINDIEIARDILFDKLRQLGYSPKIDAILIQNFVVSVNFQKELQLEAIVEKCNPLFIENIINRHRLIIRGRNPRFTASIYRSGKCMITGVKNEDSIVTILDLLNNLTI